MNVLVEVFRDSFRPIALRCDPHRRYEKLTMDKTPHELALEAHDRRLASSFEIIRWLASNGDITDPSMVQDVVAEYWRLGPAAAVEKYSCPPDIPQ